MSFIQNAVIWRALVYFAAPLLVAGTLWHQRQFMPASVADEVIDRSALQNGPPMGILPAEWEAARTEFAALTDSTLHCGLEEMPAYWRLLKWSLQRPHDEHQPTPFRNVTFSDLVNRPGTLRGAPVQVNLHVCRITSYAAPENSLGIDRLYEVWGWSEDSRGSLYVAVTPDLPPAMQTGELVNEQTTLRGHFYKLQGYVAAGAAPQSPPSAAPLIIGNIERWQPPLTAVASTGESWLSAAALLIAASFIWLLTHRPLFRRRGAVSMTPITRHATSNLEAWLDCQESEAFSHG